MIGSPKLKNIIDVMLISFSGRSVVSCDWFSEVGIHSARCDWSGVIDVILFSRCGGSVVNCDWSVVLDVNAFGFE